MSSKSSNSRYSLELDRFDRTLKLVEPTFSSGYHKRLRPKKTKHDLAKKSTILENPSTLPPLKTAKSTEGSLKTDGNYLNALNPTKGE